MTERIFSGFIYTVFSERQSVLSEGALGRDNRRASLVPCSLPEGEGCVCVCVRVCVCENHF